MDQPHSSVATLRIVNVTDVYKLDNFPHLKTLLEEKKNQLEQQNPTAKTISILTGDFLAPYLLSAIDKGLGMVKMLNATPINHVIFGNHEDDLEHEHVGRCIRDFKGTWINTNMQGYEFFSYQKPFEIIEVTSPDGTNTRKIGLIGILSNSASLYRRNAFGGAKIEDPYQTMTEYKEKLEKEFGVDIVIPLCHLYVPQDEITCRSFDFPVVIGGHDHHLVNQVIDGTLLLKAGSDADYAAVLDISWTSNSKTEKPVLNVTIEATVDFKADIDLVRQVKDCYSVLDHLKHTELSPVPPEYCPLSSLHSREKVVTLATFLWTNLKNALTRADVEKATVDLVILNGGEIRGGKNYPEGSFFSLSDLRSEIAEQLETIIVRVPGSVLNQAIKETRKGPGPGFIQTDNGVLFDEQQNIVSIGGFAFDPEKSYRVATTKWDILDGPSESLTSYFKPQAPLGEIGSWPVLPLLLSYFATTVWQSIWAKFDLDCDGQLDDNEIRQIDLDGDGKISRSEFQNAMQKAGYQVDPAETSFVDCVMTLGGEVRDPGYLTKDEINVKAVFRKREGEK